MDIFKIVPPIFGRVACPFLPHKRTSTSTVAMSAMGHNRTHAAQQTAQLNWLIQLRRSPANLTQPGSSSLQLLASFLNCRHDAHIFRQFECGLKLR
jgi:hypothetical protein